MFRAGTFSIIVFGVLATWLVACGSSSLPTAPTSVASAFQSGTWSGTGSDSFSPELVTWAITQSGTTLSGAAQLRAVDPLDGSCGSCHKVKNGTLTGTISGNTLTLSLEFPPGGDVPAPICEAKLNAVGTVIDRRITATYTGTDTCEGVYSNGVMELTRP